MISYIGIQGKGGKVQLVKSAITLPSEEPLTSHEEIINELYQELESLKQNTIEIPCPDCDGTGLEEACPGGKCQYANGTAIEYCSYYNHGCVGQGFKNPCQSCNGTGKRKAVLMEEG